MNKQPIIKKPATDDRLLNNIILGIPGYLAMLVAYDFKLFPLLSNSPMALPAICEALHIEPRPASALLSVCVSLGLLEINEDCYSLTTVAT